MRSIRKGHEPRALIDWRRQNASTPENLHYEGGGFPREAVRVFADQRIVGVVDLVCRGALALVAKPDQVHPGTVPEFGGQDLGVEAVQRRTEQIHRPMDAVPIVHGHSESSCTQRVGS